MRPTFNLPDCKCGRDHDSVEFLVGAAIQAWLENDQMDMAEIPVIAAASMDHVGWVKAADELDTLRKAVDYNFELIADTEFAGIEEGLTVFPDDLGG